MAANSHVVTYRFYLSLQNEKSGQIFFVYVACYKFTLQSH